MFKTKIKHILKVCDNETKLTLKQNQKYNANCLKLGDKWIYEPLSALHHKARFSF